MAKISKTRVRRAKRAEAWKSLKKIMCIRPPLFPRMVLRSHTKKTRPSPMIMV